MADQPTRSFANSEAAYLKARQLMPGGVSSPVRAYKAVGGTPIFIKEASGCNLTDLDGNKYIDYVASYGPLIAGHANEQVEAALAKAIGRGTSFGAPTEGETALAGAIAAAIPSIEMLRFVNSGTEATMSAVRLARAATKRDLIIKCIGCYHGHADSMLVQAGSGALTLGTPSSPGVPLSITQNTILVDYNDIDSAREAFKKYQGQIAAFIIEPVAGNMGVVPPNDDYLSQLRELCSASATLLIFDEVMTGFRVGWNGAQGLYNAQPDLTCLGKVIGGGLPVGAYGGGRKLMELVSPSGDVYQAGTLSGNPLAMAAGLATMDILKEPSCYTRLEERSQQLAKGLETESKDAKIPLAINRVGSMLTPFFVRKQGQKVQNYADATSCDTERYARFFHLMLNDGIFLPPSQFEAWFIGLEHDEQAIEQTIRAARRAFEQLNKQNETK
ncbi:MAG: glutamate-1-semialdehyde 2,1-aminomutase [Phycisphaerales bacterium]|jgi:glutamate-1-semialdehyde 2,1-aminomutase|nr:glutamate-1-semialdehyde 2,1-aminomutase [Phycisphaerales bacterium]